MEASKSNFVGAEHEDKYTPKSYRVWSSMARSTWTPLTLVCIK